MLCNMNVEGCKEARWFAAEYDDHLVKRDGKWLFTHIKIDEKFFATHAYAAAKAGIIGLTRAAASHYAREDIRFNVLAPALVDTPMSERAQGDAETMGYIERKQPLDGGRIGAPEDLDGAAVYLLSDAARAVTGQVLSVDGGWSVSEG